MFPTGEEFAAEGVLGGDKGFGGKGETTLFTNVLQPTHLLLLLIVALLFLGPRRLPEAGRALGKGLKEFRSSISGEQSDDEIVQPPSVAHQEDSPGAPRDSPGVGTPTAELIPMSSTPSGPHHIASDSHE
jgi:sec-independent protein translocase protein TatA